MILSKPSKLCESSEHSLTLVTLVVHKVLIRYDNTTQPKQTIFNLL